MFFSLHFRVTIVLNNCRYITNNLQIPIIRVYFLIYKGWWSRLPEAALLRVFLILILGPGVNQVMVKAQEGKSTAPAHSKPLFASHSRASHWPKHIQWPIQQRAGTHNLSYWEELKSGMTQDVDTERSKPIPHNKQTICFSPSPTFIEFPLHAKDYETPSWIGSSLWLPGIYNPIKETSESIKR